MVFRRHLWCAAMFMLLPLPRLAMAESIEDIEAGAGAVELRVKPGRCVTLYENQACEQRLEFAWRTPLGARYCLHRERLTEPLVCWNDDELERYVFDFAGSADESFFVRRRSDGEVLAEARIIREWVYRGDRSGASGWRLF